MRERISQLARGRVQIGTPKLELSKQTVEASIAYGQNYRGDIHFKSGNQLAFRGLISSDDSRVLLTQNTYAGTNVYIPFEVVTDGLTEDTVLEGFFSLVYNGGEYQLPYRFTILSAGQARKVPMETLEELAELAETSHEEALELFESRDFVLLPFMKDMTIRAVYDGLRRSLGVQDPLEEFLCGTGAKERVTLQISGSGEEIAVDSREKRGSLEIRRNTWGQFRGAAFCDNRAVVLDADRFYPEDFHGNSFRLGYTIRPEELHLGHNYARITVKAPLQTLVYDLDLFCRKPGIVQNNTLREKRAGTLAFHRKLLQIISSGRKNAKELEKLYHCWQEMVHEEEPTCHERLFQAAIACWRGDKELAAAALEQAKPMVEANRREDVDTYCAYLHLQVMVTDDWERREQMQKILRLCEKEEEMNESLFLVKLALEEDVSERPTDILNRLRDYYEAGSRNPYLSLQACRIYNLHPDIIKRLGEFELHTLQFGARMGMLTEETAIHVASLAAMERTFRPILFRILKLLYERFDRNEVLSAICHVLIRQEVPGTEDFLWYSRGVERDIRLTRLYDHYLHSVPADVEEAFPREIMLYFSYNSPRDPEAQRILYRNLFRFCAGDESIMSSYREQLRDFANQQLRTGRIDAETAKICEHVLRREMVDESLAHTLPDILMSREIRCEYKGFTEAIAVYGETEEELSVPMKNGVCSLPMYTDRCRVLFADAGGSRYAGVEYTAEPLFGEKPEILKRCMELYPRHGMLRLAQCTEILNQGEYTVEQVRLLKKQLEVRGLRKEYKNEMMEAITEYIIHRRNPGDEDVLTCIRSTGISEKQRIRLVEILIERGQLSEAAVQIRRMGFRELPAESLKDLVDLSIHNSNFRSDVTLLDMSYYLFERDLCDDVILEYLCAHLNSSRRRMLPVLKAAHERGISLHGMDERLLAQMLFTEEKEGMEEVFRIFCDEGTGDPILPQAYYAVRCRDYFLKEIPAETEVFDYVRMLLDQPEKRKQVPQICILALCRYYASLPALSESETEFCHDLVFELYREGMIFAWMKDLRDKMSIPQILRQKEWLEFRSEPDQTLLLCAAIHRGASEGDHVNLVLPQIYPGIYLYSTLLFDGESLSYEILREKDRTVLARGVLTGTASPEDDHSSFAEMNRLQKLVQNEKDVQSWQQNVLNYALQEAWTEQLFTTD